MQQKGEEKNRADMIYYTDKPEKGMSNGNDLGVSGSFALFHREWRKKILTLCFCIEQYCSPDGGVLIGSLR